MLRLPAVLACFALGVAAVPAESEAAVVSDPAAGEPQTSSKAARTELEKAADEFRSLTRSLGYREDSPRPKRRVNGNRPEWHGRIFEYFRNDILDAVPHEISQRGGSKWLLRRNQFGFNVSGPVFIPGVFDGGRKTFFSASYEGVRERIGRSYLRTIPTIPERTGDFSPVVDSAGNPLPIYDPQTTRRNPSFDASQPVSMENLEYLRDPFPGNRIPQHKLDPVAVEMLRFYPQPNTEVGPFFRNNYFIVSPESNAANGMIGKLDHTFTDRNRVSLEFAFSNGFAGQARMFPTAADPLAPDREFTSRRGALSYVLAISPQTVNTFSADFSTAGSHNVSEPGVGDAPFPVIRFAPYLSMGRPGPVSRNVRNSFVLSDGLSRKAGRHNLRMSGYWAHLQVHTFVPQYPSGSYRFSAGLTSLPGIVNTGHAFASYLLGGAEFAEISLVSSPSYFRRNAWSLAVRDRYELTRSFALSLGLGLDVTGPRTEKYDRQSNIDLTAPNPVNDRPGALVAAARAGQPRGFQPVRVRAEPQISITWNPRGDSKNVVRLSYDRSYSATPVYNGQWGTQGFNAYPTFLASNAQLEPAVTLSGGIPVTVQALPDLRPEAANDTIADLMDDSDRQPRYQSASMSVERALPRAMILTAGVAHSDGKNLFVGAAANPNALPLSTLEYRDRLNDQAFNRSLRPYPQFLGFDLYSSYPLGRYWRDAGFLRIEKRTSSGLTLNAYYEFSKQMDDYSGPFGTQDFCNRANEWSLTASNNPHRLSLTYAYDLPIGAGRGLFAFSDWRRYIADGWSLTGSTRVSNGEPLALRPQFNNTGGAVSALNVNVTPGVDPRISNPGPELWFNPAAFAQPPDFSVGDASRTHPSLRGPGAQYHDLSITKRVPLGAERALELSAAGFNFLNTANWNEPDTMIGPESAPNVNAGKIIGSTGGRVIQLGLRISF